jgi:glyoxylase-like metal-dependent hydrolase (beta-lactamase superfamily II)
LKKLELSLPGGCISVQEIIKDLFFIERGYLNANHFVYRAKNSVLIDTGYVSDFATTEKMITSLGINLEDVRQIISTHCHCDHIGGNRIIQQRSDCDIAMHRIGKHFIDAKDDWSTWWTYYNQKADFFNCTHALEDGDTIAVGPHEFLVIYTPGHSADGIVLYHPKEKVLLSSDTLWQNDLPVMTIRIEGSRALFSLKESLEKIESLDVQRVYPGHGKPFTRFKEAVSLCKNKIDLYQKHPERIGTDLLKKITIYTLMTQKTVTADTFFDHLMRTWWFKETVDLYFNKAYETKYRQIIESFLERGIINQKEGQFSTTVKP